MSGFVSAVFVFAVLFWNLFCCCQFEFCFPFHNLFHLILIPSHLFSPQTCWEKQFLSCLCRIVVSCCLFHVVLHLSVFFGKKSPIVVIFCQFSLFNSKGILFLSCKTGNCLHSGSCPHRVVRVQRIRIRSLVHKTKNIRCIQFLTLTFFSFGGLSFYPLACSSSFLCCTAAIKGLQKTNKLQTILIILAASHCVDTGNSTHSLSVSPQLQFPSVFSSLFYDFLCAQPWLLKPWEHVHLCGRI